MKNSSGDLIMESGLQKEKSARKAVKLAILMAW
jgi:hypothetical protein